MSKRQRRPKGMPPSINSAGNTGRMPRRLEAWEIWTHMMARRMGCSLHGNKEIFGGMVRLTLYKKPDLKFLADGAGRTWRQAANEIEKRLGVTP